MSSLPLSAWQPLLMAAGIILGTLMTLSAQTPSPPSSPPAGAARELHDLPYVAGGDPNQRLDLVVPANPTARKLPLLIWIHGGGWEGGSYHGNPARALVARGYAVASVGYRLSSQAKFPAQIEDCKAAVRWLRAHATEYGFNPGQVGVWGASAGGHLAALLGVTGRDRRFDVGENLDQSSAVQCVVDSFGPSDFLHWGDPQPPDIRDSPNNALARLLGGPIGTHQELARAASPVYAVDANSAPFFILHGDKDPIVPLQQSQVLDAALRKAGVECTLIIVPGGGHGTGGFDNPKYLLQMAAFVDRHLLSPGPAGR